MCRQYRPIGLCGHDIPEWERFDPEDPRRCAKAALLAVQKYGTTEAAVRCEQPEVVCEHPKAVCRELDCWRGIMLQQQQGWLCCQCANHVRPVRKRCSRSSCKHKACWVCPPYSAENPLRVNPL